MPVRKIKEGVLVPLLKQLSTRCGIKNVSADFNSVYGYQLVINDDERPAGLRSFKDREFEGYLNGFGDGCLHLKK